MSQRAIAILTRSRKPLDLVAENSHKELESVFFMEKMVIQNGKKESCPLMLEQELVILLPIYLGLNMKHMLCELKLIPPTFFDEKIIEIIVQNSNIYIEKIRKNFSID